MLLSHVVPFDEKSRLDAAGGSVEGCKKRKGRKKGLWVIRALGRVRAWHPGHPSPLALGVLDVPILPPHPTLTQRVLGPSLGEGHVGREGGQGPPQSHPIPCLGADGLCWKSS